MLQTQIASRTSFAVVSMCAEGSKLLRKTDGARVIYEVPELRPTVVRTESIIEKIEVPVLAESASESSVERPITILTRGTGCALHGSCMVHGFGRAVQIAHGYETRKDIKVSARVMSDHQRGKRTGATRRGKRTGATRRGKSQSWKDRGNRKQWE